MNRHLPYAAVVFAISVSLTRHGDCADLKYNLVNPDTVMDRLKDAPRKDSDRAVELSKMFQQAGCQPTQQPVKRLHEPNVICILGGASGSVILVGGHLDHADEGAGIVDDWSGASLLPTLYQSLAGQPRFHTFVFVGFAGEEQGLVGSDFYVKHLTPEQRKQIVAMVNLECLGLTSTEVWVSHSDPILVRMLFGVAQWFKLPLEGVNVERVGRDDAESFGSYKIAHVTIHSLTQATVPLLHSKNDNIQAIKPDAYHDSYRLIVPYLTALDQQLPTDGSPVNKPK